MSYSWPFASHKGEDSESKKAFGSMGSTRMAMEQGRMVGRTRVMFVVVRKATCPSRGSLQKLQKGIGRLFCDVVRLMDDIGQGVSLFQGRKGKGLFQRFDLFLLDRRPIPLDEVEIRPDSLPEGKAVVAVVAGQGFFLAGKRLGEIDGDFFQGRISLPIKNIGIRKSISFLELIKSLPTSVPY